MYKSIAWVVAVIIVAGLAYWFGTKSTVTERAGSVQNQEVSDTSQAYEWIITEADDHGSGEPHTSVALRSAGGTIDAGTYHGSCSDIEGSSWQLLENEVTGVICWWAGGGEEIGVFNENGSHVLKVGVLEEGTAETAGLRGDFKVLQTLNTGR